MGNIGEVSCFQGCITTCALSVTAQRHRRRRIHCYRETLLSSTGGGSRSEGKGCTCSIDRRSEGSSADRACRSRPCASLRQINTTRGGRGQRHRRTLTNGIKRKLYHRLPHRIQIIVRGKLIGGHSIENFVGVCWCTTSIIVSVIL